MDNVLVDFPSAFKNLSTKLLKEYDGRLDEVPGIFSLMQPLEGAKEAFDTLAALNALYATPSRTSPFCAPPFNTVKVDPSEEV